VTAALTLVRDLMGDGERDRLRLMTRAYWRRTLPPPHRPAQPQVWIVPPLCDSVLLLGVEPVPTVVFGLRRWEFGTMREHTGPWRREPGTFTPRHAKRG
jgi:hypothetical protein